MMKKIISVFTFVKMLCSILTVSAAASEFKSDFESGMPKEFADAMFEVGEAGGNHYLSLNAGSGQWISGALAPSTHKYTNFTLTCDFKPVAFPDNSAAISIYIRGQQDSDTTPGYRFLIGYQDSGSSAETLNLQFEKDYEGAQRKWDGYAAVNVENKLKKATWSKITIVGEGDKFDFYIGNDLVYSAIDKSNDFKEGSFRFATWGSEVQIDNLSVSPAVNRPTGGNNDTKPNGGGNTSSGGTTSKVSSTSTGSKSSGTTSVNSDSSSDTSNDSNTGSTVSDTSGADNKNDKDTSSKSASSDKIMGISKGIFIGFVVIIALAAVAMAVLIILSKKGIIFKK